MGILSDGTVLTTAELPAQTATMSGIEHQEIFAAGKESFVELQQVTVQLDDAAAGAEAYESVFTGETENVLTMSHWDAPSIARQAQAAGVLDEFSEQLRVIEPIEVYDPAPPPQLVADFAAVDLEAEAFMEPAGAAAVEEGAVAAGVAVPADAAAGTILETIAGVVVEAGWGLAGAMVAGAAVAPEDRYVLAADSVGGRPGSRSRGTLGRLPGPD